MPAPTIAQLKQAVQLSERIEQLKEELASLLNGFGTGNGRRTDSQAQSKRRGRPPKNNVGADLTGHETNGGVSPITKARKKKRGMSAEGRARIAAAQKARWAKLKSEKA